MKNWIKRNPEEIVKIIHDMKNKRRDEMKTFLEAKYSGNGHQVKANTIWTLVNEDGSHEQIGISKATELVGNLFVGNFLALAEGSLFDSSQVREITARTSLLKK